MATLLSDFIIGGALGGMIEHFCGVESGAFGFFRPIYGLGAALTGRNFILNFAIVSVLEFMGGEIFNRDNTLWDYSDDQLAIRSWSPANCLGFAAAATLYHDIRSNHD